MQSLTTIVRRDDHVPAVAVVNQGCRERPFPETQDVELRLTEIHAAERPLYSRKASVAGIGPDDWY